MTEPATEHAPEGDSGAVADPPVTDDAVIDDAMLAVGDLAAAPLPEHHDRLARAHEVLHSALEREDEPTEPA